MAVTRPVITTQSTPQSIDYPSFKYDMSSLPDHHAPNPQKSSQIQNSHIQFCIVTTTTDSEKEATHLASTAIKLNLAACAQISQIQSIFQGNNSIQHAMEFKISFKLPTSHSDKLFQFLKSSHSYKVPEIISTPILSGHQDYLKWIADSTSHTI